MYPRWAWSLQPSNWPKWRLKPLLSSSEGFVNDWHTPQHFISLQRSPWVVTHHNRGCQRLDKVSWADVTAASNELFQRVRSSLNNEDKFSSSRHHLGFLSIIRPLLEQSAQLFFQLGDLQWNEIVTISVPHLWIWRGRADREMPAASPWPWRRHLTGFRASSCAAELLSAQADPDRRNKCRWAGPNTLQRNLLAGVHHWDIWMVEGSVPAFLPITLPAGHLRFFCLSPLMELTRNSV